MFTGIVERMIRVASVSEGTGFVRLNLAMDFSDPVKHGESIAVNGVCLTVAEIMPPVVGFDLIPETLAKTNLGLLAAGDEVNIERSLRAGDAISGHFVQGHIDGTARLISQTSGEESRLTIGITLGDPAGIGPEVIIKALADPVLRHRARYIIYGMNELLSYAADLAEFDVFWWRDQFNGRLRAYPHDVVCVDYDLYSILGHAVRAPSKMGGEASMRFCLDAIDAAQKKIIDAVVTAPIAKESWKLAGYHFPGHTELIAQRTGSRRFAMMFAGGPLKVVLATVHIGLNSLWGRLNIGAVFQP